MYVYTKKIYIFHQHYPPGNCKIKNHYNNDQFTCSKSAIETLEKGVKYVQN